MEAEQTVTNEARSPKFTVSQETSQNLIFIRDQLLGERQRVAQRLEQIDVLIQQQEGAIMLMQELLGGQGKRVPGAGEPTRPIEAAVSAPPLPKPINANRRNRRNRR